MGNFKIWIGDNFSSNKEELDFLKDLFQKQGCTNFCNWNNINLTDKCLYHKNQRLERGTSRNFFDTDSEWGVLKDLTYLLEEFRKNKEYSLW